MAAGGEKSGDFYAVLGLKKECSDAELRNAYKKLAMRWHPDKCAASGNTQCVEEAKEKFQEIQEAYSVLSDSNKRFLYDVGVYVSDDDENEGMGEFLGEMAQMMSQTRPSKNGHESFEELQHLFVEMFQADLFGGVHPPTPAASSAANINGGSGSGSGSGSNSKRRSAAMNSAGKAKLGELDPGAAAFCFGANSGGQSSTGRGSCNSKRRNGRKQRVSAKHDVSSCDAGIST